MDGQGIESGGAKFFAPIQTWHGAHPSSYKMGNGLSRGFGFLRVNRPVRETKLSKQQNSNSVHNTFQQHENKQLEFKEIPSHLTYQNTNR
jgi:hypothetical protein